MRVVLIAIILTAAALLPVTLWLSLRSEAQPIQPIIYLPTPGPAACFSNALWSI